MTARRDSAAEAGSPAGKAPRFVAAGAVAAFALLMSSKSGAQAQTQAKTQAQTQAQTRAHTQAQIRAQQPQTQSAALSAEALAQCAQRVQQLRSEAPQLLARSERLDLQRKSIQQRQRVLAEQAGGIANDDLRAGLDYSERRRVLNDEAEAFNLDVERIRDRIAAINVVKQQYDAGCAQRPYRRADFERLSPAAQAAMRAGLDGIEVPYIGP